jgi:hypothetical protein
MTQRVSDDHVEGSGWGELRLGRGCGCRRRGRGGRGSGDREAVVGGENDEWRTGVRGRGAEVKREM